MDISKIEKIFEFLKIQMLRRNRNSVPIIPMDLSREPEVYPGIGDKDHNYGEEEELYIKPFINENRTDYDLNCIFIWGLDRDSNSQLFRINFFAYEVRILLPQTDVDGNPLEWEDDQLIDSVINFFSFSMNAKEDRNIPIRYSKKRRMNIYFSNTKDTILTLYFLNKKDATYCTTLCKKLRKPIGFDNEIKFTVVEYEHVDPVLNLFTYTDSQYTAWLKVKGRKVLKNSETKKINEYYIDWRTLSQVPYEICKNWIVSPKKLYYDIETYSTNHKQMPKQTNPEHVITMISIIINKLGSKDIKKYCLILGSTYKIDADIKVIKFEHELDLILHFFKIIDDEDPDVLEGFNIYGFDNPYIYHRLSLYGYDMPNIGRLKNKETKFFNKPGKRYRGKIKDAISYPLMDGRLTFDTLPYIRKRHPTFRLFSLDYISKYFLGRGKHDFKASRMFEVYELGQKKNKTSEENKTYLSEMKKFILYCVEDATLNLEISEKINLWSFVDELASISSTNILDALAGGEQERCYNSLYRLAYQQGYYLPEAYFFESYCEGAYVADPLRGYHENFACSDFASLYPSIMQAYNLCHTTYVPPENRHLYSEDKVNIFKFTQREPKDYKPTRFTDADENDQTDNESDDDDADDKKTKKKKTDERVEVEYEHWFLKPEVREGLLPQMERKFVADRKKVKDEIKVLKKDPNCDKILLAILDMRQNAIKIVANALYGFTGFRNGYLPMIPVAQATTANGRKWIKKVNSLLEDMGATIIYNDTDSSFFKMSDIKSSKECITRGIEISKEITKDLPKPMALEFEKGGVIISIEKKNYIYVPYDDDGNLKMIGDHFDMVAKGVLIAKKGKHEFSIQLYTRVAEYIFGKKGLKEVLCLIIDEVINLFSGKYPVKKYLTMVQQLGEKYKSKTYAMNVLQMRMTEGGRPPKPGDKLQFIVTRGTKRVEPVGPRLREIEMWEDDENREEIDYIYYIKNSLEKPLDDLFTTVFGNYKEILEEIIYKPKFSKCREANAFRPLESIVKIAEDYVYGNMKDIIRYLSNYDIPEEDISEDRNDLVISALYAYKDSLIESIDENMYK